MGITEDDTRWLDYPNPLPGTGPKRRSGRRITDWPLSHRGCYVPCDTRIAMFGLFKKNPLEKLEKDYQSKLQQAMEAQRSGNIQRYAELSEEADGIYQKIKALENTDGRE